MPELSLQPCPPPQRLPGPAPTATQPRLHSPQPHWWPEKFFFFFFLGFFQPARLRPCTHPSGKGETQFASPVAPHAHDKGRWEGSGCPLGDEIIPCKYVTHYRESKIHMQRVSKSITGSVLTIDQSLKLLALLLVSSLYKYTSPCVGAHSHPSPRDFHALCIPFSVLLDMVLCRQTSYKGTSHNTSLHLTQ